MPTIAELLNGVVNEGIVWLSERGFGETKQIKKLYDEKLNIRVVAATIEKFALPPYQEDMLTEYLLSEFEKGLLFISNIRDLGLDKVTEERWKAAIEKLTMKDIASLALIITKACRIVEAGL